MKSRMLSGPLASVVLAGLLALGVAGGAAAQGFPDRPIKLIIPYTPGGSVDPVARPLSQKLQEYLGQSVVMEYKPGAGTNIASDYVAKAKPDGYTLLLATSSMAISPAVYKNLAYDPVKDLAAVAMIGEQPFSLVVNPTLPVKSTQELISYARANPGKLSYGSSGNGGAIHLGMELFKSMAGIDMLHVPFSGGGPTQTALIAGDIQVMLSPASNFVQHAKSGRVRLIGVASPKRVEGLDLPTVAESGLPAYASGVWMAIFAPAATPRAVIDKLNAAVNRALKDKQISDTYQNIGMVTGAGSPDDLGRAFRAEVLRWQKLVRETGAKVD